LDTDAQKSSKDNRGAIRKLRHRGKELVDILHKVVVYSQDDSYTEYNGQAVIFDLTKTDGTQIRINAYNPFIIIDGVGYKAKYEPCEKLSRLGNILGGVIKR